ncbi:hypothetical protein CPC08DRAFT_629344 [Agrocybe pediades]|nr:hypothetical protein CPC08DRAFT_629344 [Agrocybe pediades]
MPQRIFIGPMPEKVVSHHELQGKKKKITIGSVLSLGFDADDDATIPVGRGDKTEDVSRVLKENALRFFLHRGGDIADWGEEAERHMLNEMMNHWKESDWGQLWHRRHHRRKRDSRTESQWFGKSFEVGNLLGLNFMEEHGHLSDRSRLLPSNREPEPVVPRDATLISNMSMYPTSTTGLQTFVTANSEFAQVIPSIPNAHTAPADSATQAYTYTASLSTASSQTGLLQKQRDDAIEGYAATQPSLRLPLVSSSAKGKAKVQFSETNARQSDPREPVPAEEVLSRTKNTVDANTSMAATVTPVENPEPEFRWGDIVLKDRMLVRVSYTKSETITEFNDAINRTTRDLHYEDWGEFLVAWRRDSVEIYRDHNTPGKEWLTGHKHLSYVIPLRSSRTRLSLFSFVDMSFCITCAPATTRLNANASRWIFSREKEGTNIFVFKLKSRSRAYDWIWQLWKQMGGEMPRTVDIHNPRLNTKVTIDVPENAELDSTALYDLFKRENVIKMCMELLPAVPDWQHLVETEIKKGKSLQLAWRLKANLDWVWLETDVEDKERDWAVLCGLAFRQSSRPPVLEIRLADHAPDHILLKDGKRLEEPPALEGYLDRIKPNTQSRNQTYLSTHNGNLFILNPLYAFPPMPPGLAPVSEAYANPQSLRQAEIRRGSNQIMTATGVCDLRTIIAVRRASHPTSAHIHSERESNDDATWARTWQTPEERIAEDEEDEGGEVGLNKSSDRSRTRVRRSFELLLKTGHVVRFEAFSCGVAIEWVDRLRALIFYWKNRHRIDAKEEIDLAQALRPRLTPQTRVCEDVHDVAPEAPVDLSLPHRAMDNLFNWCILEGCHSLVKGGRLYMKKGLHGQYKLVQLFLVAGHLVRFRIGSQSSMYPSIRKKINLLDAYVYSGYFAAQTLPKGQYRPNAAPAPRRYQDGLETNDPEEDMLFMISYRPQPHIVDADYDPRVAPFETKSVPQLSAKHKMLIFKTRSLFERDSWCWALNCEIEKIVRAQRDREAMLRETGNLITLNR